MAIGSNNVVLALILFGVFGCGPSKEKSNSSDSPDAEDSDVEDPADEDGESGDHSTTANNTEQHQAGDVQDETVLTDLEAKGFKLFGHFYEENTHVMGSYNPKTGTVTSLRNLDLSAGLYATQKFAAGVLHAVVIGTPISNSGYSYVSTEDPDASVVFDGPGTSNVLTGHRAGILADGPIVHVVYVKANGTNHEFWYAEIKDGQATKTLITTFVAGEYDTHNRRIELIKTASGVLHAFLPDRTVASRDAEGTFTLESFEDGCKSANGSDPSPDWAEVTLADDGSLLQSDIVASKSDDSDDLEFFLARCVRTAGVWTRMPNGPTTKFKFPDGGKFFYGEKAGLARDGTGRIHFLLPVVRETDDGKRMPRFLHGVSKEDGWDLRSFGDALDGDASGTFGFHDYEMSELVIDDSGMVTFAISSTWDYTFGATDADGKWRIASPRRSKWTLGKGVERGAVILGK